MLHVLVLSESWQEHVYGHAHTHTEAGVGLLQNLRLAALVTWDWHMILCVCAFVLCAAGRTDDSSYASLPTRAALLPSNTDQTAVARRRVKCSLKPLISLSLSLSSVFLLYLFLISASYY